MLTLTKTIILNIILYTFSYLFSKIRFHFNLPLVKSNQNSILQRTNFIYEVSLLVRHFGVMHTLGYAFVSSFYVVFQYPLYGVIH